MVVVLGIISIIIGGAIVVMDKVLSGGELTRVRGDFQTLGASLQMYRNNAGHFPSTQQGLGALVKMPVGSPHPKMWSQLASQVPEDPWGNPYQYKYPGSKDAYSFEIISVGRDGQLGTADDISSQSGTQ